MIKTLFLLGFFTSILFAQSPEGKTFTIDQCVNIFDSAKVESTKAGYQYWFAGKNFLDGRTLKMSVVAPHEATHAPHRHPEDEFFFVLEGTAEFYLNGETKTAGAYASFYCPPRSEHGIRNIGDSDLKYLVIKKYEMK
ncbi:MAG: cupin domain-containing protein [Bacteroidota bacterium]|jgi:quercetin dioxygenase-like cupin family protein